MKSTHTVCKSILILMSGIDDGMMVLTRQGSNLMMCPVSMNLLSINLIIGDFITYQSRHSLDKTSY